MIVYLFQRGTILSKSVLFDEIIPFFIFKYNIWYNIYIPEKCWKIIHRRKENEEENY